MIPVPDLDAIKKRASFHGRENELRDRLVSVLFALPSSMPMRTLRDARAFWDAETGDSWDLFFAGYYSYKAWTNAEQETDLAHHSGRWWFDPKKQVELAETFSREHAAALPSTRANDACANTAARLRGLRPHPGHQMLTMPIRTQIH